MQGDLFETMYGVDEPTRNPQYPQAVGTCTVHMSEWERAFLQCIVEDRPVTVLDSLSAAIARANYAWAELCDAIQKGSEEMIPQQAKAEGEMQDWLRRHLAGRGAKRNTDGSMHIEIKGVLCRYWFRGNMLIKEQFVSAGAHKGWLPVARYYTLSYYKALKVLSRSWL